MNGEEGRWNKESAWEGLNFQIRESSNVESERGCSTTPDRELETFTCLQVRTENAEGRIATEIVAQVKLMLRGGR